MPPTLVTLVELALHSHCAKMDRLYWSMQEQLRVLGACLNTEGAFVLSLVVLIIM